jgi:ferrochelatase
MSTEPASGQVGALVMAHGTPSSMEELPAFVASIRRGRPLGPAQMEALESRYRAIGGVSPLSQLTARQVEAIARCLDARAPGRFLVSYGAKHLTPSIEDAVDDLASKGVGSIVGLVLAPQYSRVSIAEYESRASSAASTAGVSFSMVKEWHLLDGFLEPLAGRVASAIASLPDEARQHALVIFSAHSIPERLVASGDPYATQVAESAGRVAELAGLVERVPYEVVFQSAGMTEETWLGPDIRDVLRHVRARGSSAVVVCPVGFVSDHLEVLYDLDVEAARIAAEEGVSFVRTSSLNDDPHLMEALARLVEDKASCKEPNPPEGTTGRAGMAAAARHAYVEGNAQ